MNAHPYLPRRLYYGLPLLAIALLLVIDPAPLDFALANWMYEPGIGFVGKHSAFLEDVLHDKAKQAVIAFAVLSLIGFLASFISSSLAKWRRPLGYTVLAMTVSTGLITPIKKLTQVQCPWSLEQFGGVEHFSPLLGPRAEPVEKAGQCWPGGHAAAGFSLFALFFALRGYKPRLAHWALALALGLGIIFSIGRMLQGAHFLSHNLWTAALCWLVSLGLYDLILYRPAMQPVLTQPQTSAQPMLDQLKPSS